MTMKSAHYKGKGPAKILPTPKSEMKKQFDGDSHFCYNLTILIGSSAEVTMRDGRRFAGVFVAFSAKQEVMLEAAHLVEENDESVILKHFDALVIPSEKVLAVRFEDVDLSYATRDFQIDGAIVGGRALVHGDKELTPWDGADTEHSEDLYLDGEENRNGWEAQEMFKKNEENFGVVSTYNENLTGYTTQIDKSDPEKLQKHEEEAKQVALEIEKNSSAPEKNRLDNGEDEEDTFSAVVRPRHYLSNNVAECTGNDKYIPPSRRQHQSQPQHGVNAIVNHPTMNGPGQVNSNRKQVYSQSLRNNFGPHASTTNVYHSERRNYDSRRGLPPNQSNQYGVPGNRDDNRTTEDVNRAAKPGPHKLIKGREDMAKTTKDLQEFHSLFALQQTAEPAQNRRAGPSHQYPIKTTTSKPNQPSGINAIPQQCNGVPGRNISPATSVQQPVNKARNDIPSALPLSNLKPLSTDSSLSNLKPLSTDSSHSAKTTSDHLSISGTSTRVSSSSVPNDPVKLPVPTLVSSAESEVVTNVDTLKDEADCKSRKFTFNPNAKEFNPTGKQLNPKSPSTPPRPPSTPAAGTQQIPSIHSFMPMQTLLYNSQQYTQGNMVQTTNPSISGGHRPTMNRKGIIGGSQRPELGQQMQLQGIQGNSSSLMTPPSIQPSGPHPQYAIIPSHYSQVRIHPQNMVSMYSDGSSGTPLHVPIHYFPHNGAAAPQNNSAQPTSASCPNPSGTSSVVSSAAHSFAHGHSHYPLLGMPMVGWSQPQASHQMISTPYVPHQGVNNALLPHNQ